MTHARFTLPALAASISPDRSVEEKLQIEESSYINSEKLLQSKMEECLQVQKELSQARNRFLTLEKSEEFITIIRELSEGKEELEL